MEIKKIREAAKKMGSRWEQGYLRHARQYLEELKKLGCTPKSLMKIEDGMERMRISNIAHYRASQPRYQNKKLSNPFKVVK